MSGIDKKEVYARRSELNMFSPRLLKHTPVQRDVTRLLVVHPVAHKLTRLVAGEVVYSGGICHN